MIHASPSLFMLIHFGRNICASSEHKTGQSKINVAFGLLPFLDVRFSTSFHLNLNIKIAKFQKIYQSRDRVLRVQCKTPAASAGVKEKK